jgi:dihydrofolate reductase
MLDWAVNTMRKLIYYVACSVDGFIARRNGSFDYFLNEGEHLADLMTSFPETIPTHLRHLYPVSNENKVFDTVLMGRRTYEVGLDLGFTNPYGHLKQYLFSRSMERSPDENVTLVASDPPAYVRQLKRQPGKDIWLCGGADLAAALFGEIDELILKVNPAVIGSGIPLFSSELKPARMKLISTKPYSNGFVLLHYQVQSDT